MAPVVIVKLDKLLMVPVAIAIAKSDKLLTFSYFVRQIRNGSDGRLVNRKNK